MYLFMRVSPVCCDKKFKNEWQNYYILHFNKKMLKNQGFCCRREYLAEPTARKMSVLPTAEGKVTKREGALAANLSWPLIDRRERIL